MTRTSTRLSAGLATTALLVGAAALLATSPADAASSHTVLLGTVQLAKPATVQLATHGTVQLATVQLGAGQLGAGQLAHGGTVQLTVQL